MVMISGQDKSSLTQKIYALSEVRADTEETTVVVTQTVLPVMYELRVKETADHKQLSIIDCKRRVSTFKKCRS
jgi:hypothetical protein